MSFSFLQISKARQYLFSLSLVAGVSGICFLLSGLMGYRMVAFILLLTVSLIALLFDIMPVLLSALVSAVIWDFFFIPPRFTFRVGTAEDSFLLLMYFVIALINAVLTYRIRKAEKIAREKEEKANAVKLYNTLLSSLSHELKTPIATIVGASDNLLTGSPKISEANKKELIAGISVASLRLNQQVENLLSMSRLESGFIQPKYDWCDINELVYHVVNRLEQPVGSRQVKISIEDNLPFYRLDYGLMEQVLYNLLYNASVYTPDFSDILIVVKNNNERIFQLAADQPGRSAVSKEINRLIIIIEDSGPGFPEEEIEKVFDKFYRLKNTKPGGTGLGLSIVKGFVEAQQGAVTLENVPHGARFTIDIPAEVSYLNNLKNE
ncbi:MAG: DUF4118 domain-containing protein [Chitinophagaceae bacterium]|nr:DUF4118 domain-containing protein [Chitinophagaceae bacterium]